MLLNRQWPAVVGMAALLVALACLYESHQLTYRHAASQLRAEARVTGQLRVLVLQSELEKQRSIPLILAGDSDVIGAITHATTQADAAQFRAISLKLEKLERETKAAAIYILNAKGTAMAASNWSRPTSFVGSDYSFRDYFKTSMLQGSAEQFALGTVSHKPGLYLGRSILNRGQAVGVVVVKVEFDDMEATWAKTDDQTFVTDAGNNILLTFQPAWRFLKAKQPGPNEFLTSLPVPAEGWQLHVISSLLPAEQSARTALAMAVMMEILLATLAAWWWRRRRQAEQRIRAEIRNRQQLELNVASRTEQLSQANARLSQEITERQQAEQKLNQLQADLVQANKLASLGQIIAGVAHEINQPLATIRTLAENILTLQKRQPAMAAPEVVTGNIHNIVRMSDRIGHITGELRAFSRKATAQTEPIPLKDTVDSSILLNKSRLKQNPVKLVRDPIDAQLKVMAGRIRLEQVLVNLLQNAFEALEDQPHPKVRIGFLDEGECVILTIADNGPGLAPEVLAKLFTPFVTTKLAGLGLGLIIAHDIIRDFGGELWAENTSHGANFHIRLRKVSHD
jgi:two-component system C4-dicarboxylate transport sensor histidine kinase DctB